MKRISIFLLAVLMAISAIAKERSVEHRMVVDIPFYLAGGEESDIRYDLDSVALVNSLRNLELLGKDSTSVVKSIEFYSSVSPEGTVKFNREVGQARLVTAERIIRRYLNVPDSVKITYDERYIPWHSYLLPAIKADSTVPYRENLIKLIYRPANSQEDDNRRVNLKLAKNGELWKVVEERYFDHIRKGGAIIVIERIISEDILQDPQKQLHSVGKEEVKPIEAEALSSPVPTQSEAPQPAEVKQSDYALHLKTNALSWGLALTNASVEFDFAKHWSVSVPIYYSAHNYFTPTIKFRTLGVQPEVRYWLKENNTGFFAGAHLGVASYNIAVNGDIRYQDHAGKRPAFGGGLSVGYRLPLAKKHENWNIEFTLGAGVYGLHYDTFYNVENGRLIGTQKKTYWGIDNAGVNISYRFDLNKRKR